MAPDSHSSGITKAEEAPENILESQSRHNLLLLEFQGPANVLLWD